MPNSLFDQKRNCRPLLLGTALLILIGFSSCRSIPFVPFVKKSDGEIQNLPVKRALPASRAKKPKGPPIARSQVIATAQAYHSHPWSPTERNAFHGLDKSGIQVDTPDKNFQRAGTDPGWWKVGQKNYGIPYQWGGFSSLSEFDRGIQSGKYAGDVYTKDKRKQLDKAVSKQAVGVDCSGFVSRCLGLTRSYSTRDLPGICTPLMNIKFLLPGDILNAYNSHVILFYQFADKQYRDILGYEVGAPPTWKVALNRTPVSLLLALGFKPYRYNQIVDG